MTNPFESHDGTYVVLVNEEHQYSLWPEFAEAPAGWTIVRSGTRRECLDHVEATWTDMRPRSLADRMDAEPALEGES